MTSTTVATTTTSTRPVLEQPPLVDLSVVPLTSRTPELLDIDSLDHMAADAAHLYVRREAGVVETIDPASFSVLRSTDLGSHEGQGIGVGGGSVWAGARDGIVRIDGATGELLDRVELVKVRDQGHLPFAHGLVWVLVDDGDEVVGIDPATAEPAARVSLPVRGLDLAPSDEGLWVASSTDDRVVHVDLEGEVLASAAVEEPRNLAIDGDVVWVSTPVAVHRLDADGTETGSVGAGSGRDGNIAVDEDGALWVRNARSVLHRIDAETLEVTERVDLPLAKGGDVVVAFGAVWATAYDEAEAVLFRLTP